MTTFNQLDLSKRQKPKIMNIIVVLLGICVTLIIPLLFIFSPKKEQAPITIQQQLEKLNAQIYSGELDIVKLSNTYSESKKMFNFWSGQMNDDLKVLQIADKDLQGLYKSKTDLMSVFTSGK